MTWKNILKNDPSPPPMPPKLKPRQKYTKAALEHLVKEKIIPEMKKKDQSGKSPYIFDRGEDQYMFYTIFDILEDRQEDDLIRAFGALYGRDPEIVQSGDNKITIEFYDSKRNPFTFQHV